MIQWQPARRSFRPSFVAFLLALALVGWCLIRAVF